MFRNDILAPDYPLLARLASVIRVDKPSRTWYDSGLVGRKILQPPLVGLDMDSHLRGAVHGIYTADDDVRLRGIFAGVLSPKRRDRPPHLHK